MWRWQEDSLAEEQADNEVRVPKFLAIDSTLSCRNQAKYVRASNPRRRAPSRPHKRVEITIAKISRSEAAMARN